jgi:hypothetical protein
MVSSRPKEGTRPVFKFFRCANDFKTAKSVLLAVNATLHWLNNVSGVYLIQVSLILLYILYIIIYEEIYIFFFIGAVS